MHETAITLERELSEAMHTLAIVLKRSFADVEVSRESGRLALVRGIRAAGEQIVAYGTLVELRVEEVRRRLEYRADDAQVVLGAVVSVLSPIAARHKLTLAKLH